MISRRAQPIEDIIDLFPSQYVLLGSCRFDDRGQLTHGRVLESSTDSDDIYDALRTNPNSVIIYTGPDSLDHDGAFLDSGQVWEARSVSHS